MNIECMFGHICVYTGFLTYVCDLSSRLYYINKFININNNFIIIITPDQGSPVQSNSVHNYSVVDTKKNQFFVLRINTSACLTYLQWGTADTKLNIPC